MIKYLKIHYKKGIKYKLIKVYKHFGLYIDKYNRRECFSRFDLGTEEESPKPHIYLSKLPVIF